MPIFSLLISIAIILVGVIVLYYSFTRTFFRGYFERSLIKAIKEKLPNLSWEDLSARLEFDSRSFEVSILPSKRFGRMGEIPVRLRIQTAAGIEGSASVLHRNSLPIEKKLEVFLSNKQPALKEVSKGQPYLVSTLEPQTYLDHFRDVLFKRALSEIFNAGASGLYLNEGKIALSFELKTKRAIPNRQSLESGIQSLFFVIQSLGRNGASKVSSN